MLRKIVSVLLLLTFLWCVNGCDTNGLRSDEIVRIGAMSDSGEQIAARMYSNRIGARIIEYESSADAVTALENGKVDYVSLNEYDAQEFIDAQRNITFYDDSGHKLDCRAVFSIDNTELCKQFDNAITELTDKGIISQIKEANLNGKIYKRPEFFGYKETLVMVCDPVFDDRVYYDADGNLAGTDIDIARVICETLGYNLEISVVDFELLFMEIESGNADFIMSSVEYTEERAEHFLFSEVYSSYEYNIYTVKQ